MTLKYPPHGWDGKAAEVLTLLHKFISKTSGKSQYITVLCQVMIIVHHGMGLHEHAKIEFGVLSLFQIVLSCIGGVRR